MPQSDNNHFNHIFWFIVGLCTFGAGLTIFLIVYMPAEAAQRVADTALIFWLSTAVSGGIGYLIGSSAKQNISKPTPALTEGGSTLDMTITASTEPEKAKEQGS